MSRRNAPRRKLIRRKKAARKLRTVTVNRALQPIAQRYIAKLKYSQVITTDATVGVYQMNLNSLFQPDRISPPGGGQHQPYGFDQLALLYNRYRVIACGYRMNLALGSSTVPITVTAMPTNTPVASLSAAEIRENPRAKYITQNPGAGSVFLTNKISIPSLVGRTKSQYMADDRYQATVIDSPNEAAVLNIQTFNGAGVATGNVQVQLLMEYTVEFFDIKSLGQS